MGSTIYSSTHSTHTTIGSNRSSNTHSSDWSNSSHGSDSSHRSSMNSHSNLLADLPGNCCGDWGADFPGHGVTFLHWDLDGDLDGDRVTLLDTPGVTDVVHHSVGDGLAVSGGPGATDGLGDIPRDCDTVGLGDGVTLRHRDTAGHRDTVRHSNTPRDTGAPGN